MTVFLDTSAIYALLNEGDLQHVRARRRLQLLFVDGTSLLTSNYVVVEACALLQRRIGLKAVRALREDILPRVTVAWVTERQHDLAFATLLASDRRHLSLVDCASFQVMRDNRLQSAFAFDTHFTEEGFDCDLPMAPFQ